MGVQQENLFFIKRISCCAPPPLTPPARGGGAFLIQTSDCDCICIFMPRGRSALDPGFRRDDEREAPWVGFLFVG